MTPLLSPAAVEFTLKQPSGLQLDLYARCAKCHRILNGTVVKVTETLYCRRCGGSP